jgi:hypothetical protein
MNRFKEILASVVSACVEADVPSDTTMKWGCSRPTSLRGAAESKARQSEVLDSEWRQERRRRGCVQYRVRIENAEREGHLERGRRSLGHEQLRVIESRRGSGEVANLGMRATAE